MRRRGVELVAIKTLPKPVDNAGHPMLWRKGLILDSPKNGMTRDKLSLNLIYRRENRLMALKFMVLIG